MKKQAFNPYLPEGVYIPDGEPHVFDGRVYVYGSHDKEGGTTYCEEAYSVYSAPVDDLSDWSSKGISYDIEGRVDGKIQMYAPDCCRGNDGRYYLYYCVSGAKGVGGYGNPISVAVSEHPDGPFSYYGFVKDQNGAPFTDFVTFDPAVINDEGTIRLYYGTNVPFEMYLNRINRKTIFRIMAKTYHKPYEEVVRKNGAVSGPVTVELAEDMLTVVGEAKKILPTRTKGFCAPQHTFFEAGSIRKINGLYYFIYSSIVNHELCYATSRYPDRDFRYRGVIISNGDIGYQGISAGKRLNFTGNNHGSIEKLGNDYYIFYHRMTHGSDYSRQGCAEKLTILPDGTIPQVETTSCGLNAGPLRAEGTYPAYIYADLTNFRMPHACNKKRYESIPQLTHSGSEHYLTNLEKHARVGYKYFDFRNVTGVEITYRAKNGGSVSVSNGLRNRPLAARKLSPAQTWTRARIDVPFENGIGGLFFSFRGSGTAELLSFTFIRQSEEGETS